MSPPGRLLQAEDDPAQGRFAAARFPHETQRLAGENPQADPVDRPDRSDPAQEDPARDRVVLHHVPDLHQRLSVFIRPFIPVVSRYTDGSRTRALRFCGNPASAAKSREYFRASAIYSAQQETPGRKISSAQRDPFLKANRKLIHTCGTERYGRGRSRPWAGAPGRRARKHPRSGHERSTPLRG